MYNSSQSKRLLPSSLPPPIVFKIFKKKQRVRVESRVHDNLIDVRTHGLTVLIRGNASIDIDSLFDLHIISRLGNLLSYYVRGQNSNTKYGYIYIYIYLSKGQFPRHPLPLRFSLALYRRSLYTHVHSCVIRSLVDHAHFCKKRKEKKKNASEGIIPPENDIRIVPDKYFVEIYNVVSNQPTED